MANGLFHARGLIHQSERTGLGWEFAGTIDAAGPGVSAEVGAKVAGLIDGFDHDFGTYAEYLVVSAADIAPVPEGLDLINAATVPLNGLAAVQILDLLGDPPADANRLLVAGAAGALGSSPWRSQVIEGGTSLVWPESETRRSYGVSAPTSPTMLSGGGMR